MIDSNNFQRLPGKGIPSHPATPTRKVKAITHSLWRTGTKRQATDADVLSNKRATRASCTPSPPPPPPHRPAPALRPPGTCSLGPRATLPTPHRAWSRRRQAPCDSTSGRDMIGNHSHPLIVSISRSIASATRGRLGGVSSSFFLLLLLPATTLPPPQTSTSPASFYTPPHHLLRPGRFCPSWEKAWHCWR